MAKITYTNPLNIPEKPAAAVSPLSTTSKKLSIPLIISIVLNVVLAGIMLYKGLHG